MRYRFEDFVLDTNTRELSYLGQIRPVEPQVFDLLEYLIASRNRVVSSDDIFSVVWRGRVVSDGALSTRINAARHAVNDNGMTQRLIQTVRKKGFRFIGRIDEACDATTKAKQIVGDRPRDKCSLRPSIAVLPFIDVTTDGRQSSLADALTEESIACLSQADWLSVASRSSSFAYKNKAIDIRRIARKLGVRYLLEGTVRRGKTEARVVVRLIDGLTGCQIWSKRRDDKPSSLLVEATQDSVVADIVHQVYAAERLYSDQLQSEDASSWAFIVHVLSLMNSRVRHQVDKARNLLNAAFEANPAAANICSMLSFAITLGLQQGWHRRNEAMPAALHTAEAALALNAEEPWAHVALGYARIWQQPEEALLPLERALALNPRLAIGHYLFALALTRAGCPGDASKRAESARELSSFDLLAYGNDGVYDNVRASACLVNAQYNDGIRFAKKAITESPQLVPAYRQLVANCALAGRVEEAKEALLKLKGLSPRISLEWIGQELTWSQAAHQRSYVEAFRTAGLT